MQQSPATGLHCAPLRIGEQDLKELQFPSPQPTYDAMGNQRMFRMPSGDVSKQRERFRFGKIPSRQSGLEDDVEFAMGNDRAQPLIKSLPSAGVAGGKSLRDPDRCSLNFGMPVSH